MRNKLILKLISYLLVFLILPISAVSVAAREEDYDYEGYYFQRYKVEEELLGKVNYEVCCSIVLHDDLLTAQYWPISYACTSYDQLVESSKGLYEDGPDGYGYDHTMKSDQYPKSYKDIVSQYDEAFFEDNFLAIAAFSFKEGEAFTVERIDYVSGTDETICIAIDFEPDYTTMKKYYVFVELPRKYYAGTYCVAGYPFDDLMLPNENPKTGDSVMLLPAVAALVISAAGIVCTKKRKQ